MNEECGAGIEQRYNFTSGVFVVFVWQTGKALKKSIQAATNR